MHRWHKTSPAQRQILLERTLKLFLAFCQQSFATELYPYQVRIARACLSSLLVERKNVYIKIARQAGKCLAKGTPVLMFDGSIKPVEEIRVGDQLMGDDSTPRNVLALAQGRERMWRVQPNNGYHEPYVVNESHILTVACRRTGRVYDRSLRTILALKRPENSVLGIKAPVRFPDRPVPMDPYWLGLWLGDGCSADVGITTADPEVVNFLWNYAGDLGMVLSVYPEKNRSDTYAITWGRRNNIRAGGKENPLRTALRLLGLHKNKHIPDLYRVNGEDVRLALLAGLIDSDGHRSKAKGKENVCELVFRSKRLAADLQWLARSLGFRASLVLKVVNGTDYWRVMLYGELWRVPTKIKRKQYAQAKLRENPLTYGFTLVDEGEGDYYGFEIDGNKRFLLGDCTVTHNTEGVTLVLKFLMIFLLHLRGQRLMAGVASPNGEQAKTDVDRLKASLGKSQPMRDTWELEDTENNAKTIRAIRRGDLHAEVFVFSLKEGTSNESKTLNVLLVEEAHKINDQKCDDELVPMLSSTGGVSWRVGVGCTQLCDFKRGCDGQLPDAVSIIVPVDEVIRDRRAVYEKTGDPSHLEYEKWFASVLAKYGRMNPEIRRNFYLEDTVEEGNFISRERFTKLGRVGMTKGGLLIPCDDLTLAIDWGRRSDWTWAGVMNRQNDLIDMVKIPHARYEEQIAGILEWLKQPRKIQTGEGVDGHLPYTYFDRIGTVRGDSNGIGDFPMEYLRDHSGLPMGDESMVGTNSQSKNEFYLLLDAALYRDPTDPLAFSYPADHPLAAELEEQMTSLLRLYTGNGEYLSPQAPKTQGSHDDACSMSALCCLGAVTGKVGEIVLL